MPHRTEQKPSHQVHPSNAQPRVPSYRIPFRRLIEEDEDVEGVCWFSKRREDPGHIFANLLRIFMLCAIAPAYSAIKVALFLISKIQAKSKVTIYNPLDAAWMPEMVAPLDAVLYQAPGDIRRSSHASAATLAVERYEPTAYFPSWLIKATSTNGRTRFEQVPYAVASRSASFREHGYIAISYNVESAITLFRRNGGHIASSEAGNPLTLAERQTLAQHLLTHCWDHLRSVTNGVEYVWIDELCLISEHDHGQPEDFIRRERKQELGRLADIFRHAAHVCVFCDRVGCEHVGIDCAWGQRLFTLAEILHAAHVIILQRLRFGTQERLDVIPMEAHTFRHKIQHEAACHRSWHLEFLMQATLNAGAFTWQSAIHALIVEAIRRDNASGFANHELLGAGLNGLLPRRARTQDLKREDGWKDLAWLLELNQGFYNAAALASVCTMTQGGGSGWLGAPIEPREGNERLEPLATAFPVCRNWEGRDMTPLGILGVHTIGLYPTMKRDSRGLYNSPERDITILRWVSITIFVIVFGSSWALVFRNTGGGLALLWLISIAFIAVDLVVGTMYLERHGWVFVSGRDHQRALECLLNQDRYFFNKGVLAEWGSRQLAPEWDGPRGDTGHSRNVVALPLPTRGILADLSHGVYTRANVYGAPNCMAVLAIHGSGVTCMLLHRPTASKFSVARKCGMANVPPYILQATERTGTVYVASA